MKVYSKNRKREVDDSHVMDWALAPVDFAEGDVFFVAQGKSIGIVKYQGGGSLWWIITATIGRKNITSMPVDDPLLLLAAFEEMRRELCG